jgi:Ser/Thr protein kinase RdoA (MazF antagonist)
MKDKTIWQLFYSFVVKADILKWAPYGNGHINDTILIQTTPETSPDYILQRKNHKIFKDVPGMLGNIVKATNHIRQKLVSEGIKDIDRRVMTYYPAKDGEMFVRDEEGNYWTLFLFIPDSRGIEAIENPEQAFRAARAFGYFQKQLSDLPGEQLIETIPNFHNGISRLKDFQRSIDEDKAGRVEETQELIAKILNRAQEMTSLQKWLNEKLIPLRITHNDTKINNILFDDNDNALCIIDLDTVMPGSALYDFGDAIRTIGNKAPEDEPVPEKIQFNREIFEAFAKGYMSEAKSFLIQKETDNLAFSCLYMAWEQAMRFLTDYLNADIYYKIAYPLHNLVRTKSQVRYLEVLEENRILMEDLVKNC